MFRASRSLSRSLILAAMLVPACAAAAGQVNLSPPVAKPAPTVPAKLGVAKAVPAKVARASARAMGPKAQPPQVIYAHPLHRRVSAAAPVRYLAHSAPIHHRPHQVPRPTRAHSSLPSGAIVVSTQGLNRFVFPAAVVKGPIFPADAPVLGSPVYLDANRQVLVQFVPGANKPFEMVVELAGHQVKSYLLAPRNVPGVTFHARGVRPPRKVWKPASAGNVEGSAHHAEITLLRSVVMGEIPDAFYPTRLPPAVHFNKFNIVPRSSWSDGAGHRILVYTLVSVHGQAAVVAAPEFYRKGMAAILLSGEVVDATHSPLLYILEGARRGR